MATKVSQRTNYTQKAKDAIAAARDLAELQAALADLITSMERVETETKSLIVQTR